MAANSMLVPLEGGKKLKISAGSDSIPHIQLFLRETKKPFRDKIDFDRYCDLKTEGQRLEFIEARKLDTERPIRREMLAGKMSLAPACATA
ncbi:MAG TPA: hypothetical protein VL335_00545 [Candidatus Paceibacterota bacterium]|jgi:hypothetical protein|nr:hypothetical protein [Candidatus Paceibacterota bacterium]